MNYCTVGGVSWARAQRTGGDLLHCGHERRAALMTSRWRWRIAFFVGLCLAMDNPFAPLAWLRGRTEHESSPIFYCSQIKRFPSPI